jgi:hypothetical protein
MKAALALLLTAGSAFGAAPVIQLAPTPIFVSPFAALGAPLALQASPSTVFSAPALPILAPSLAITPRPVVAALPALSALTVLPAPSIGDAFDGAFAEKRKEEAEAVQYAHAEIPVVDYRRGAYDEERAQEFMEGVYTVDEKTSFTGRELLSFLVTPEALRPDLTPDPDRVDFSRLGRTSAQVREIVEEKGMPYHPYERVMTEAFRDGLIYRLYNKNTGLTYHGVPPQVRSDWKLEPAPEAAPVKPETAAPAGPTPFSLALAKLALEAELLPKSEELFEFTAQTVAAAIKAGKLAPDAVTPAFKERAAKIDVEVSSLSDAVITLAESAEGTPWEGRTAALLSLLD